MFPEIRHALQQHEVVRYLETENIRSMASVGINITKEILS